MKYKPAIVQAAAGKPAEILVYGPVGKSFWSDEGISGKEFADALNAIPEGTKVTVGVNSQGGAVGEGLAIYNAIARRAADVTVRVDGYALSIASFFPLAAPRIVSPKSSIWMIHKAWNYASGNADDLRKDADMLDTHDSVLSQGYAAKTGKTRAEIDAALADETWMTGEEALAYGLATESSDEPVTLEPLDFAAAKWRADRAAAVAARAFAGRPLPSASVNKQNQKHMNKTAWIAALKTHGVIAADDWTDEQFLAEWEKLVTAGRAKADDAPKAEPKPQPASAVSSADFQALKAQLDAERRERIGAKLDALLATRNYLDRETELALCLADEKHIGRIAKMPEDANAPVAGRLVTSHGNPLIEAYARIVPIGQTSVCVADAKKRIAFRRQHGPELEANMQKFLPQAANTISSTLKPDVLTDALITVAVNRLASWGAFTRRFSADIIRPGATVVIKKASAGATGQTNPSNWESGDSTLDPISIAPAHKTVSFHVSSGDRNYGFDMEDIAQINAQNFSNLLSDVVTAIMTTANYGAATSVGAAAAFDFAALKPVLALAKNYRAKNLLLDGGHRAYLAPTDKFGFEFGNNGMPAFGFDVFAEQNRWTGAATNAVGFVCAPDALGVATGLPVNPASPSFDMVGSFQVADLGISVLYTSWFNTATRIQWASYEIMCGAAAGDTTQAEVLISS